MTTNTQTTEKREKSYLILRVELFEEAPPELLVAVMLGKSFAGVTRVAQESIAGEYINGKAKIIGYNYEVHGGLMDFLEPITFDFYDLVLHPRHTLIGETFKGDYLVLDEEDELDIVPKSEALELVYFNAVANDESTGLVLECNLPVLQYNVPSRLSKSAQEKLYFQNFKLKDFVVGRIRLSNSNSRELESCKIVSRSTKLRKVQLPSYINSIGHSGLKLSNIWCNLAFNKKHIIRADSIDMDNVTLNKLTLTTEQVLDSHLNFLHKGVVAVTELELLNYPTEQELYTLMDIIVSLNRYVDLDGFFCPEDIPSTFGESIIKSISVTHNDSTPALDMTDKVYQYAKSLARWYSREFTQLVSDCTQIGRAHV